MIKGSNWTAEEDCVLRALYSHATTKREDLLSALPKRTWKAILSRANKKLGLTQKYHIGSPRGTANPLATGKGQIIGSFMYQMRQSADTRNLERPLLDGSDEGYDYLNEIITEVCPLSGRPLTFPKFSGDQSKTASLDRIDSSLGYVKGNVRWVHKTVNIMKKNMGDAQFMDLIEDMVEHCVVAKPKTDEERSRMKKILVCTIARNVEKQLPEWAKRLERLRFLLAQEGWLTDFSVYENDSTDLTSSTAKALLDGLGNQDSRIWFTSEVIGTKHYGSIWNIDRLRNLANARQKCLDQIGSDALQTYHKIAYIEPDVTYDPVWCSELVLARHPRAAGLGEPDIYSGWSLRTQKNPKESIFLFDTCATRATKDDVCWDITERNGTWRGATVVPTDLGGHDAMCLHPVWSTFSCFCVYNAEPFKRGVRWGFVNARLNTGQTPVGDTAFLGWLDADTSVVCEAFRARGYDKVYLNTNCLIRHA
jgi:hypothetical protein